MSSKVTAVLCLSAHKSSQNLVCCCLYAFTQISLLLLVNLKLNAIPWYYVYAHTYGHQHRILQLHAQSWSPRHTINYY